MRKYNNNYIFKRGNAICRSEEPVISATLLEPLWIPLCILEWHYVILIWLEDDSIIEHPSKSSEDRCQSNRLLNVTHRPIVSLISPSSSSKALFPHHLGRGREAYPNKLKFAWMSGNPFRTEERIRFEREGGWRWDGENAAKTRRRNWTGRRNCSCTKWFRRLVNVNIHTRT